MSTERVTRCDRCREVRDVAHYSARVQSGRRMPTDLLATRQGFDLCIGCRGELRLWLRGDDGLALVNQ